MSVTTLNTPELLRRAEPINDKWLQVVGVPLAVLPFVLFYLHEYGYEWRLFVQTFSWGMVSTAITWQVLRWWVMRVRLRYADQIISCALWPSLDRCAATTAAGVVYFWLGYADG